MTWKSIPPSVNFISEYKWLCKLQNTDMPLSFHPSRLLNLLILVSTLALASCGGGTTTAGSGGSGIGGTGITTVTGNVVEVIASAQETQEQEQASLGDRMIALAVRWIAAPVSAAATDLADIRVVGGGQITTTDENGDFVLEDVSPSDNFILTFELENDRTINLPIGTVPAGTLVQVSDIVINADEGFANPGDIDIEENPESGSVNSPGNSQNASDNNRAGNASANSNENAADQAAGASGNNRATGASSGANSNAGGNK